MQSLNKITVYSSRWAFQCWFEPALDSPPKTEKYLALVVYLSESRRQYAFIDYFVYVHDKVFAILTQLKALIVTCQEHFGFATPVSFVPVERDESIDICSVDCIIAKCLFLECGSQS